MPPTPLLLCNLHVTLTIPLYKRGLNNVYMCCLDNRLHVLLTDFSGLCNYNPAVSLLGQSNGLCHKWSDLPIPKLSTSIMQFPKLTEQSSVNMQVCNLQFIVSNASVVVYTFIGHVSSLVIITMLFIFTVLVFILPYFYLQVRFIRIQWSLSIRNAKL